MLARRVISCVVVCVCLASVAANAAEWGLKEGTPDIKSAGPLAFGPDGIVFIGDAKSATVFAIGTGDKPGQPAQVQINVEGLNKKVAELLGTAADNLSINDLATNPQSGNVFLSITKGKGAEATPALVKVNETGKLSEISLKKVPFLKVTLPNAPEDKEVTTGGRTRNRRTEAITDIAYAEGKVFISGLAAGESPSNVREIPFPFSDASAGTSVEIFHGAHGKLEDFAAIRTFVPLNINGEASLLAGFTCTPLVKIPVKNLKPGEKTRGTTVAELGNMNQPLDMIAYKKDGKDFLLMSNSRRGVMKITTEGIAQNAGITEPVRGGGTAGQTYETIKELDGVVQLDKLGDERAVILVQTSPGSQDLRTIPLP